MDCIHFPELSVNEWGDALITKLSGERFPLGGMFELTDRCNFNCVHCYINQPANSQDARASELTTDQVKHLLDQLAEAGTLFLVFTGGEPLLRPDFPEIFKYARQQGIIISLFTNATMVTPRIADLLAEWRVQSIETTLYGATSDTYERFTRVPGSFELAKRGIELLLARGLPLSLKSVLLKLNLHELQAMRAYAETLGVNFHYDGLIWPRNDGSKEPLKHQISIDQLIQLDIEDPERQKEWHRLANKYHDVIINWKYVYNCGAGLRTFHIDSKGMISACTMARKPAYDLRQMSFLAAWKKIGELRKKERKLHTPCETCSIRTLCPQCPGWSQAFHGDDETPVEFVCQLSHKRAEILSRNYIVKEEEIFNYE